jgi:hypothetical protein
MGRYDNIIESAKDTSWHNKYRLQGFTLMIILLVLTVNLVKRQETVMSYSQNVISQDFELCVSAICLGGDNQDVTECISLVTPMLTNVSFITERYAKVQGVKRIMVKPLSECR